jgi:hypothetical protein
MLFSITKTPFCQFLDTSIAIIFCTLYIPDYPISSKTGGTMNLSLLLPILSGICWTIVYIDCIRLGFKQKTFSMPLWALALNITWEFLYSFSGFFHNTISFQTIINLIWALFDIFILITYLRFGFKNNAFTSTKRTFYIWTAFVLLVSFVLQYSFVPEFTQPSAAASYSAYLQNVLMSILFVYLFKSRQSDLGQSRLIAYSKFIGTLAPTIQIGILGGQNPFGGKPNTFVLMLGIICAIFDIMYIVMLQKYINKKHKK